MFCHACQPQSEARRAKQRQLAPRAVRLEKGWPQAETTPSFHERLDLFPSFQQSLKLMGGFWKTALLSGKRVRFPEKNTWNWPAQRAPRVQLREPIASPKNSASAAGTGAGQGLGGSMAGVSTLRTIASSLLRTSELCVFSDELISLNDQVASKTENFEDDLQTGLKSFTSCSLPKHSTHLGLFHNLLNAVWAGQNNWSTQLVRGGG